MSPSLWDPFLVKSEKWALTGCDLTGLFQAASLGWSEFSHRLFPSGGCRGRPAQMWVFAHAVWACPLAPLGLSSLLRQPVSFSFILNFSLEIATPKPAILIMQDMGGLNLPCRCVWTWAVLQGEGPRASEMLPLPAVLDLWIVQLRRLDSACRQRCSHSTVEARGSKHRKTK